MQLSNFHKRKLQDSHYFLPARHFYPHDTS